MGLKDFFKTMLMAFNPAAYEKLAERKLTHSMNYYASMVGVMFLLMCMLFLPLLVMLPRTIEMDLQKFDVLDINITQKMNSPISIREGKPMIILDSSKEYTNIEEGNVLITKGAVFYKLLPFTEPKKIVREGDLLENKGQIATFLMVLIIAMLPMLLAAAYIFYLIKYLLVIILAMIIAFIAVRIVRFGITFGEIAKVAFFSSTIMAAVGLLTKPFVPSIYFLDYILFAIFFVMGIMRVGSFESVVRPKKFKRSAYEG